MTARVDAEHLLVQSVVDFAIFGVDPDGLVITWHEGGRRTTGYEADEILGRPVSVLYLPDEAQSGKSGHQLRMAHERGRFEEDGWRLRRDGSRFWANVVITPVRDPSGGLIGFANVIHDLTQRKRTEEHDAHAFAQERAARSEAEAALARVRAIDRATERVLACPSLTELLTALSDRSAELLHTDTALVLLLDGDHLRVRAATGVEGALNQRVPIGTGLVGRVAAERRPVAIEYVTTSSQDAELADPVLSAGGLRSLVSAPLIARNEAIGVLTVAARDSREFTDEDARLLQSLADRTAPALERARLHEEARASQEHLRLLLERVEDYAIFLIDTDGRIASWNLGAERIKGYTAEEIIGRPYATFFTPEDREAGRPAHLLQQARLKGRVEDEGWRVRKDGTRFWADAVLTALYDAERRLRGYAKVTRDLTERRQAEQERDHQAAELERRSAALREVNEELEAFSYSVSHDLRAPLRAMRGFAEALVEDHAESLDAEGQEYARRIAAAAERMDRLIQDILAHSRLSRADLRPQPVSLRLVVADALRALSDEVRQREAHVDVHGPLPDVAGHHATLVQVVSNLIGNAVKFVAAGVRPRVRVWAEEHTTENGDWVRLSVADNGIGIAPEHAERIFGVLERLHGAEAYPGTGIGLAIVRRGVERLGGRAGVESTPGLGSRFWLELPAATGHTASAEFAEEPGSADPIEPR